MGATVYQYNLSNLSKREQRIVAHLRAGGRVGYPTQGDPYVRRVWWAMIRADWMEDYPELDPQYEWVEMQEEKEPGTAWVPGPLVIHRLDEALWRINNASKLIYA